jgi:hypothetical protein
MEKLQQADTLVVQQKKEWGEILTGFETRNKYSIMNGSGEQVGPMQCIFCPLRAMLF